MNTGLVVGLGLAGLFLWQRSSAASSSASSSLVDVPPSETSISYSTGGDQPAPTANDGKVYTVDMGETPPQNFDNYNPSSSAPVLPQTTVLGTLQAELQALF